ncbi:MAG TPA: NAD-dependent epimerase/dehydratase family protein [Streptosporangiaceae bacterium]
MRPRSTPDLAGRPRAIMIIGASGYLGRHVRDAAAAAGLDVSTAGRSPLPGSCEHSLIDLATDSPAAVAATLSQQAPDVVVNCAGATGGDVGTLAAANVTGTATLVSALRRTGRSIRLVHLGSAAEYGPSEPGTAVAESDPARPAGAYGATKLAATRLVELGRVTGLDAVVLRVFNPVGPGAPDTILPGRLVGELRRAAADGSDVRLGPLGAVRDFVDARDVADAAVAAALAAALPAAVINVGSGTGVPVRTLVRELVAISGYDGSVTEGAPAAGDGTAGAGAGGTSWQQADIGLARRDLDWEPRRELTAALADLWEECRAPAAS